MAIWMIAVRIDGRGGVAGVVVVLVQKVTEGNLKCDTLIAPCVR